MTWLADALALAGGVLLIAGVYVEFGGGWALIAAGVIVAAFGINLARLLNAANDNGAAETGKRGA